MAIVISPTTPDQTVILATVQITDANSIMIGANKLFPKAYADDQATTQVRILVSNPPQDTPLPDDPVLRIGKGL